MNKKEMHQLIIKELIKLRRDQYAMQNKAIKTAKQVKRYLRAGNREQAEAHKAAATDMAQIVDFIQAEIDYLNLELGQVLGC